MKYKKIIISLIIYFSLALLLPILNTEQPVTYRFLPGETDGIQLFFFMLLMIFPPIIFGILFGYLFSPLYLAIHKYIFGRKMNYGIQKAPEEERFKKAFRGFFPALMSINLSLLLVEFFVSIVINEGLPRSDEIKNFMTFIFLLLLTIGPATGLFSASWFLDDAGISFTNNEKVSDLRDVVEVRGIGKWYIYALKGYAGIGVIFSYFIILMQFLSRHDEITEILFNSILTFLLPFLLSAAIMPTLLLFERLKEHRVKYIRSIANKLGIKKVMELEVKLTSYEFE
ncbi:MAG: membrane protein of unknown function [Promethearchaeota archaeon]|nr:MAG: membrane protein of unknown function [Candidatus Lokiarchaeota archaeon]